MTIPPEAVTPGALDGVRILDLSRVFAGPWCAQLLADFGADVIKVENPDGGDDVRHMGAPLIDADGRETGDRSSFLAMNRGKRSIAINIAHPAGQDLVRRLAAQSDVVIENFRTGTLARYGLDYHALRAINPRLIYCSITGFGQTGPLREAPGYDAIFQARSGVMSVTGSLDRGPSLIGYSASDINAGLYAAVAILAALRHRDTAGGAGQHIDLSLLDAQISSMSHLLINHLVSGKTPVRSGSASQINAPWEAFACEDGPLMITIGNTRQFVALVDALGMPDVAADARFGSNSERMRHSDALLAILKPAIGTWRVGELSKALTDRGVSCAPVLDVPAALADPQILDRQMVFAMHRPDGADVPSLANPINFSVTPAKYDRAPPLLDEHCHEILAEVLKLTPEEILALNDCGAVGAR